MKLLTLLMGAIWIWRSWADGYGRILRRKKKGQEFGTGTVACYLSHYKLWQHLADENIETAIVLEDDAKFAPDFVWFAGDAACIPYKWDVINLCMGPKPKKGKMLCEIGGGEYRVIRGYGQIVTAAGYLISQSALPLLLAHCYEISEPIDRAYSAYWRSGIKYYAVAPSLIMQDDVPSEVNTIDATNEKPKTASLAEKIWGKFWRRQERIAHRWYNLRNPLPKKTKEEK